MGKIFGKNEGIRSAAARGQAPSARGDGPDGRGPSSTENLPPKLAKRRLNKHSTLKSGRTIGERREHLETANERLAARKKVKKRQNLRIILTIIGFSIVAIAAVVALIIFLKQQREDEPIDNAPATIVKTYRPSIEIVDENSSTNGISTRMREYIGQLENDLRELKIAPTKAVIPAGSIREVNLYLDGYTGYIKTVIDRGSGVTAEDIERMLRYLNGQGITTFEYIDVRIDGKAYWK